MWRCSGGRSKGSKTETLHWTLEEKMQLFFFPLFEQYQSEYHCYSIGLLFRGTRLAAPRPLARPAESTGERSILPSASCLRSSGCRAGAPQRSTSSHAPSDPPQVPQAAPAGLANHGPLIPSRGRERGARHRSSLLSSLRLPRPSVL